MSVQQAPTQNPNKKRLWMLLTIYISLAIFVVSLVAYYSLFDMIIAAILALTGAYLARSIGNRRYVIFGAVLVVANVALYVIFEAMA